MNKILFRIYLYGLLMFFSLNLQSQIKDIGLPFIINHHRNSYNASTQNWSATQSEQGYMYFANNDGILEFNGTQWNLFPMPNFSIVRSVYAKGDTIFGGAFEQFGFLAPDSSGAMRWNSLTHLVPPGYKDFDEVWRIYEWNKSIVFQSFQYIFILARGSIKVIKPEGNFGFMHQVNGNLYVVDDARGLMIMEEDTMKMISTDAIFFRNELPCLLPYGNNGLLAGTSDEGLFISSESGEFVPWQVEVDLQLRDNLFSGIALAGGNYAFGSINNGVYISDKNGRLLQHINRVKGLQNNTILTLFQDRRQNLWLGLDNGIDFLEISSPLTWLNHNYNIESAYSTIIHNNYLYVGTNQGLFAVPVGSDNGITTIPEFKLVRRTEGQVWNLAVIDNTLFCGHNSGCFVVEGLNARQISDIRGFWSFVEPEGEAGIILAGTYNGVVRMQKLSNGQYLSQELAGFTESSRTLFVDNNNHVWVAHGYKGLFRLTLSENFLQVIDVLFYFNESGLPDKLPYNIQQLQGEMIITTREGIMKFDPVKEKFMDVEWLNNLLGDKGFIDKLVQDSNGNLWYYTESYLGVLRRLEDGSYTDITSPFTRINNSLLPAFQNIYIADIANIFIGSQNGLVHYNPLLLPNQKKEAEVFFTQISFYGQKRNHQDDVGVHQAMDDPFKIPYSSNSVTFRYTAPVFENPPALQFSYRLRGFDKDWSPWDQLNFKEYTNLKEGDYVFDVKARSAYGLETEVTSFAFVINPPFFRTQAAYIFYFFLVLIIIAGNVYFLRNRLIKIREKEKSRHDKKLARREQIFREQNEHSEREIVHLRNERLQSEMSHKNKELANATLHLIQKNKTLTSLKNDLGKLLRTLPSDRPEKQNVNNLLKKVNRDLRNEKNWELFNNYFDEVHQDFINRLKEKHSELSPRELRLCAYLRMNLSTKEIAPLMNISVRGVEISRYRLRKKLQIEHDTNLTEYLLTC